MTELASLPNVRKIFIPDPGYIIFDADLAGADAQVVAWEADDEDLKAAFRAGLDVHDKNAEDLWGSAYTKLAGNSKEGPKSVKRKQNKVAVHATNYGASSRTLAISLGWTVREADDFQKRWFSIHPGIKTNFHGRVERGLRENRTVKNAFGYHRIFFDRIDNSFTEALAWIPQSTVALVSFEGAIQLKEQCPYVEYLLQVHDSLVFQVPISKSNNIESLIQGLTVPVPYSDPLTIPWGIARSPKSWGDCKTVEFVR
jgi:DNA polymerase-1